MNRAPLVLILSSAAVCLTALIVAWSRHENAAAALRSADHRLASVRSEAEELLRLRSIVPSTAGSSPRDDALVAHVRDSLARTGLPDARLSQLSRPPDRPLGSAADGAEAVSIHVRTEVIVLEPVTVPELGRWLAHWRESQPSWIATQINLRSRTQTPAGYAATIHLSTVLSRRGTAEAGS